MTKLVSLRVIVATDDAVDIGTTKARLQALLTVAGTEADSEGKRIHWATAEALQGQDAGGAVRKQAAKPRRVAAE